MQRTMRVKYSSLVDVGEEEECYAALLTRRGCGQDATVNIVIEERDGLFHWWLEAKTPNRTRIESGFAGSLPEAERKARVASMRNLFHLVA